MSRPRTRLFEAPMEEPFTLEDGREVTVKVLGLIQAYDSIQDDWFTFGFRARCQGDGCDKVVDTPIAKRPGPHTRHQASMYLAAQHIEPRGCVQHHPATWF